MSRTILQSTLLLLLISLNFRCKRTHENSAENILTGKLVIDDGCGQFAVEVLAGSFDPARVVASWTDSDDGRVYHNIFRLAGVRDACAISYYGVSKGELFQFQIDSNPQNLICETCAIHTILALPPISNAVKNVKK